MKLKKIIAIIIVVTTAAVMGITLSACQNKTIPGADAIIMIDVGAQVEMVLDATGKVITVNALNEDGEIMIIDTKYSGQSYKIAVENFVTLAINMGYVNKLNNVVYIDSICNTDQAKVIVNRDIFNVIKTINKTIEVKSYSYKLEKLRYKSFITNIEGLENLSFLQYRMISSILKFEESIVLNRIINLNIRDLTLSLVNLYKDNASYGSAKLARSMRENIKSIRKQTASEIIALQDTALQSVYNGYVKVYTELFKLLDARANKNFTDGELDYILATIGIVKAEEIAAAKKTIATQVDGKEVYSMNGINAYIEMSYLNRTFATDAARADHENKINIARKFYDPLYIDFSAAEKSTLVAALEGLEESANIAKVEHVYQAYSVILALEGRLAGMYSDAKAELDITIIKQLEVLEQQYTQAEKTIKAENKQLIDDEIKRVRGLKQKRLDNYSK